jgi:hypothetical protein
MATKSSGRMLKILTAGALALSLLAAFAHPFGKVKRVSNAGPLLAGADIDSHTEALLERSCQNCHSERTTWPWYSYVPPASWMIEHDVREARLHLNFSQWNAYSSERREAILGIVAAAVRNQQMPPGRYTVLHPGAVLSNSEREQIYRWARGERRRLARAGAGAR